MEMGGPGGSVMVMTQSSPHVLQNVTDALTLIAFGFLCYAVYRVARPVTRSRIRAGYLGGMTALLAVATFFDAVIEHRVVITFNTLYLSQVSFALVIVVVSLALRGEALTVEKELQLYKTHMDDLVEARVREARRGARAPCREGARAARDRRRAAAPGRGAERPAADRADPVGRATLEEALEEATDAIAPLFGARYARVHLVAADDEDGGGGPRGGRRPAGRGGRRLAGRAGPRGGGRHPAENALIAEDLQTWPGLTDQTRLLALHGGAGVLLADPLPAMSGPAGVLVILRDAPAEQFSADERQLARTIGDALAAVIEIDRLHRQETRQAAAEERQALARDLHDAVTQSIYSATLIAEALPAVYERDPDEGLRHLQRLRRLVRAALAEMRTLLFELRPAALENAPLDALLERLGDALAGQSDVEVAVSRPRTWTCPPTSRSSSTG